MNDKRWIRFHALIAKIHTFSVQLQSSATARIATNYTPIESVFYCENDGEDII